MSEGHSAPQAQAHVPVPAAPAHGASGWLGHAGRAAGIGHGLGAAGALGSAAAGAVGGAGGGLGASLAAAGHKASEAFHARPTLGGNRAHEDQHDDEDHAAGHEGGADHEETHADHHGADKENAGPGQHKDEDNDNDEHENHEREGNEQEQEHEAQGHQEKEHEHEHEGKAEHAPPGAANNAHDTVDHHDIEEAHKSADEAGAGGEEQGAHEGGNADQEEGGDAPANHDQSHASASDFGNSEEQPGENPDSLSHKVDEGAAAQVSEHLPNLVTRLQKNFGEDFSNVKFSSEVPDGAKAHGAKAVAGPDHVALDPSVNLATQEGKATLGEELGHVTQMRRNSVQPDALDQHGAAGLASAGTAAGESRDRAENEAASAGAAAARGERVNISGGGAVPQNLFFGLGGLWDKAKKGVASVTNTVKSAGSWVLDKGKQVGSTVLNAGKTAYNGITGAKDAAFDRMNQIENPLLKLGAKTAFGVVAGKIPGIHPMLYEDKKNAGENGQAKFLRSLNPLKWAGAIKQGAEDAAKLKPGGIFDRMGLGKIGEKFTKANDYISGKVNGVKDWGLGKLKGVKDWGLGKLKGGVEGAKNLGKSAFSAIKSAPGKLVDKIKGMFPSKGGPPGFFGKLMNSAKEKVGGFFGKAKGLAGEMFSKATKLGGKALDFMKGMPGKAWDLAKTLPGKAFEGVKGLGGMIKNLLPKGGGKPGLFGKAMAGLKRLGGPVMNTLGKLGGKALPFVQKMGSTIGKLGKAAMPVLQGIGKTLKTVGPGALKVLGPVGKFLGKAGAKIIPGLNIAATVISTGMSAKAAYDNFKDGNITGGLIDSFNTVTNAIGAVPVIGGVVSVAGDLISGGLHWLTGK